MINKLFGGKNAVIFLFISFNMHFGARKNCLIKKVLLRTHNICFGRDLKNSFFNHAV